MVRAHDWNLHSSCVFDQMQCGAVGTSQVNNSRLKLRNLLPHTVRERETDLIGMIGIVRVLNERNGFRVVKKQYLSIGMRPHQVRTGGVSRDRGHYTHRMPRCQNFFLQLSNSQCDAVSPTQTKKNQVSVTIMCKGAIYHSLARQIGPHLLTRRARCSKWCRAARGAARSSGPSQKKMIVVSLLHYAFWHCRVVV